MDELGSRTSRSRVALVAAALIAFLLLLTGCTVGSESGTATASPEPAVDVTLNPASGTEDVNPVSPISATASQGTFTDISLVNTEGRAVQGVLSPDRTTFTVAEALGYGATYTWNGTALGTDGKSVAVDGSFTTLEPEETIGATLNIADGQEVGIAAPIIVQFHDSVEDKAAVEKAMTVTTNPPTPGAWAWLADDNGSRAHWRPQNYWAPGTTVALDAKLYGVDFGGGAYGEEDLSLNFTVGRSQIVIANAPSHRMQVVRGGETIMDIPVSYGEGNEARNVTRSGIHMVTEKHEDFLMSNPPFYENVRERWAVRISNNGEFIHANPETVGVQGSSNVTNGCINLSLEDAQQYFGTAMYGDPVEVTGTSIDLSPADGDIYDWAIDWSEWQSLSALA
ncbi:MULTISPECIES: Ig-like domain-containing protein [unclassified Rhodococcus (in: high G+C Gram-positive bacteria)]|uniref:L,D-transpeptidase n=1 Tax=unclassified Rhodococcus (in: high G+C Gram-positive bacteria) TaxID=192944 RepID=UPI00163A055D|nr:MULTISPECIES: Ig-like domain-containing protein [unclassified Rhodococcus (in: high G+C Gram-positive bacteria)]MBC2639442.1 L,D-transpeptidase [Rhodococcus sp. 3A]MBC2895813.1 L,D-transpeptidase [Rhodococcus sp. 4CII]